MKIPYSLAVAQRAECLWCRRHRYGEHDFGVFSTLPRKDVLWVTQKPFEVTQKTRCCGRVTTEFFCPEIIAVWQNGQMADQPDNQLSITEYLQRQGELWQTQR